MKWQPIETAPIEEDGPDILVWTGYSCDVVRVGWHTVDGKPVWFNGDVVREPTHWMHLPDAPE